MSRLNKKINIITDPNPILRQKSLEISQKMIETKDFQELYQIMAKLMIERDGVGLAAPQIGQNIRLITVNTKDGVIAMINPKITKQSIIKEWGEEGCLSVPGVFGEVKRYKMIRCKFISPDGKERLIEAKGMLARVIQHEIDHLDGILFIDKMRK